MNDPFAAPPPPPEGLSGWGQPMSNVGLLPNQAMTGNGEVVQLATVGRRFLDLLLTFVLVIVTLVIGYLIWTLFAWQHGQSPSKQILKIKVVDQSTGQTATFGKMFIRSFLVGTLLNGFASSFTFGIYTLVDYFMVFSKDHTRLTDKIAGTYVVPV